MSDGVAKNPAHAPADLGHDSRLGNPQWADNWTIGSGLRMEFIDRRGQVWLCQTPVTVEQAQDLPLPGGASLALLGQVVADAAYFARSPGAEVDGPLDTMDVDGLRFSFVARPLGSERIEGATVLSIDKHHTMLYAAGRLIELLDFGDGTFATPAWQSPDPEADRSELDLPSGWALRTAELTGDLVASIPNPSTVVVLADGSGFHGPVSGSRLEDAKSAPSTTGNERIDRPLRGETDVASDC